MSHQKSSMELRRPQKPRKRFFMKSTSRKQVVWVATNTVAQEERDSRVLATKPRKGAKRKD